MDKCSKTLAKAISAAIDRGETYKADLSARAKIARSGIDQLIDGTGNPTLGVLERLADALGREPWQLIDPGAPTLTPDQREAHALIAEMSEEELKGLLGLLRSIRDKKHSK